MNSDKNLTNVAKFRHLDAGVKSNSTSWTDVQYNEELYRDLFENANDAILIRSLDGVILDLNHSAEVLTGYTREKAIGQNYNEFLTSSSRAFVEGLVERMKADGQHSGTYEIDITRRDGTVIPVETRARLIRTKKGVAIGIQSIHRNISERKAHERQRAEFLAMLTHDIKNPLSVIIGYTHLLLEDDKEGNNPVTTETLQKIMNSARTIHSLSSNYLQASKIEAGPSPLYKQRLRISALLEWIVNQYTGEAQLHSVALTFSQETKPLLVEGDESALERVFANLIHNAIKFTPTGGRIMVGLTWNKTEAVVSVSDSGPGIATEELGKIFDKYTKGTVQHYEGAGLGLYIVKNLIEAHGGHVEVTSTLDQGTCFSVRLPLATGNHAPSRGEAIPPGFCRLAG
ncbi:MAG: sensor histidine kinase [Candidatus Binatia bacterium]